jgi:predicted nucleic acid-binding protein
MKYILDSSVAVKWGLREADSDKADALRDDLRFAVHDFLSPDIFTLEASHALTRAERQGRLLLGQARTLFIDILTTAPTFVPFQGLLPRAIDISSKMRIGVYDCLYVALAEHEQCELITADVTLVNNLHSTFPFILKLASKWI